MKTKLLISYTDRDAKKKEKLIATFLSNNHIKVKETKVIPTIQAIQKYSCLLELPEQNNINLIALTPELICQHLESYLLENEMIVNFEHLKNEEQQEKDYKIANLQAKTRLRWVSYGWFDEKSRLIAPDNPWHPSVVDKKPNILRYFIVAAVNSTQEIIDLLRSQLHFCSPEIEIFGENIFVIEVSIKENKIAHILSIITENKFFLIADLSSDEMKKFIALDSEIPLYQVINDNAKKALNFLDLIATAKTAKKLKYNFVKHLEYIENIIENINKKLKNISENKVASDLITDNFPLFFNVLYNLRSCMHKHVSILKEASNIKNMAIQDADCCKEFEGHIVNVFKFVESVISLMLKRLEASHNNFHSMSNKN